MESGRMEGIVVAIMMVVMGVVDEGQPHHASRFHPVAKVHHILTSPRGVIGRNVGHGVDQDRIIIMRLHTNRLRLRLSDQ